MTIERNPTATQQQRVQAQKGAWHMIGNTIAQLSQGMLLLTTGLSSYPFIHLKRSCLRNLIGLLVGIRRRLPT